jgi:hypothetical protein
MNTKVWKLTAVSMIVAGMIATAAAQERVIVSADYGVGNRYRADVTSQVLSLAQDRALNFVVSNRTLGVDPDRGRRKNLCIRVRERNGRISEYRFQDGETVSLRFDWQYENVLSEDAQRNFDNAYGRWQDARRRSDWNDVDRLERKMRDIMSDNRIPPDTPYDDVASPAWDRMQEPRDAGLHIERATYGTDTRNVDVTGRLQGMVRNNSLEMRVTSDNLGGDPAHGQLKRLFVVYFYNGQRRELAVDEKSVLKIP